MSRALALLLSLCALVLPSIARAHGRVDVRVPSRASGAVVAELEGRVGSPEFLQRDPEGFVDSVNVYAAMANDPINNRDPTGRFAILPVIGWALAVGFATAVTPAPLEDPNINAAYAQNAFGVVTGAIGATRVAAARTLPWRQFASTAARWVRRAGPSAARAWSVFRTPTGVSGAA